jgi:hypothetical protein
MLSACSAPKVESQRMLAVEGNRLQVTSGTIPGKGRYITIVNSDKRWSGKWKGGKEKWKARAALMENLARDEIHGICGESFFEVIRSPVYNMMDKDETMGGMAPVLGIGASMIAHLAADANTDPANVPVSLYAEFGCRFDKQ